MISIGLGHYLTLAAIIFTIGIVGLFLNRKNIIVILMSIELILLAVNINLVSFAIFLNDISGQIFTLFLLTVAAAEAAIGLAIIVVYYRNSSTINVENIDQTGFDGDFIESQAFAYIALRTFLKKKNSFPSTTGVAEACVGGNILEPK